MDRSPRLGRRDLLRGGAAIGAAVALPFAFTYRRAARAAAFGSLVPDPAGVLDLPPGFSYSVVQKRGDPMSDGHRVPGRPDAMAVFTAPDGDLVLMRNHELSVADAALAGPYYPDQPPAPEAYDPPAPGGVTRVVLDPVTLAVKSSNLVLVGTLRNCAGGPSPWGWITCEETVDPGHGYAFLCRPGADAVQPPFRIPGYGRYRHEAACVHPDTHLAYLTEDRPDGCLYRFVPADVSDPFTGTLQALRVVGWPEYPTTEMPLREPLAIEWVDVPDPCPLSDTVRVDAREAGAALFVRGEGIWFHDGAVYVCCTSGGPRSAGQIFRLVDDLGGAHLELLARSEDTDALDHPDNITLAPWGHLYMAEDGDPANFIRVLTEGGAVFDFARNALSLSELCGVCFAPDGQTLFVNLQTDGLTLAIRGPFQDFPGDPGGGSGGSGGSGEASDGGDPSSSAASGDATAGPPTGGDPSGDPVTATDASMTGADTAPGLAEPLGCDCDARGPADPAGLVLAAAALAALRRA